MSDTKTLGEQLREAKGKAEEAQFLASQEIRSLENRLSNQAFDYAQLQNDPDYQQAMLAQWKHWREARKASGLSIEEFIRARWEEEKAPNGSPPAPCSCGPMEACSRCPEVQDPAGPPPDDHATHLRLMQEREASERFAENVKAVKEAMAHAKQEADAARRLTLALYPNAEKTQDFEASLKEVRALVIASEMRKEAASHSPPCKCAPCAAAP